MLHYSKVDTVQQMFTFLANERYGQNISLHKSQSVREREREGENEKKEKKKKKEKEMKEKK